jgi:dolichol-phosphate mannosyltransferase
MRISIIVPFYNEAENVSPVIRELQQYYPEAEIVAVDDGSTDGTFDRLSEQKGVRTLSLPRNMGQSAAVYHGLKSASGDVCVLIDGDGQSNVSDIKTLLAYLPEYDFVNGCRERSRQDGISRVLASRIANHVRNWFTGDGMRDTGGTPKMMKRQCVDHLIPFDGLHRFIPAILKRAGFLVVEVPVSHRHRLHGQTKYTNAGRAVRGIWDLIGVRWLLDRSLDEAALQPNDEDTKFDTAECEITDPVGHPAMMMAEDDRGDLDDRRSTGNHA